LLVLPDCIGSSPQLGIVLRQLLAAKTGSLAEAPTPIPEFNASDQQIQVVQERWQDFEQKTRAGQPAEIELSADDVNALIATTEGVRGKVLSRSTGIYSACRRVCRSEAFSADRLLFQRRRHHRARWRAITGHPQFSRITINGEQVPTDFSNGNIVRDTCAITSLISGTHTTRHDRDTRRQSIPAFTYQLIKTPCLSGKNCRVVVRMARRKCRHIKTLAQLYNLRMGV